MTQGYDKEYLKNKFQNIEILIDENVSKDPSGVKKLVNLKNNSPSSFELYLKYILRIARIFLNTVKKNAFIIKSFISKVIIKIDRKIKNKYVPKLAESKKQKEILIENSLVKVEKKLNEVIEKQNLLEHQRSTGLSFYQQKLSLIFGGINMHINLDCYENELENYIPSLDFDLLVCELVFYKLLNGKMLENIAKLDILYQTEVDSINCTLEFELKIAGELWAKFFSKYIASSALSHILNYQGSVKVFHVIDIVAQREKLVFSFHHQRAALFTGDLTVKGIPKEEHDFIFPQKEEQEKLDSLKLKKLKEEQEKIEKIKHEAERLRLERLEIEKIEKERLEKEKLEKLEKERMEKEMLEQVRLERLEKEKLEKERLDAEKHERERVAKERNEKRKLEREQTKIIKDATSTTIKK